MNEIIKQLADQAKGAIPLGIEVDEWIKQYNYNFARLIVRECVSIGDNYQDILGDEPECFNCRKVAYGIVDKIKQHFGVEQ